MLSLRNDTLPSHNSTCAPPGCMLKISPFGPQSPLVHRQPDGPIGGELLLLMTFCILPAVEFAGPETLIDLSGSAQRLVARYVINTVVSI